MKSSRFVALFLCVLSSSALFGQFLKIDRVVDLYQDGEPAFFKAALRTIVIDENYFILDVSQKHRVLQFDREGQFVRYVGASDHNRGPVMASQIQEVNGKLAITNNRKIFIYTIDGIKEKTFSVGSHMVGDFVFGDPGEIFIQFCCDIIWY